MTKQEVFDVMVRGLASQGWEKCQMENGTCKYTLGDKHCAVGWLVPELGGRSGGVITIFSDLSFGMFDDHPAKPKLEALKEHRELLEDAQDAHDGAKTPSGMREAFEAMIQHHSDLAWPADVP